MTLSGIKEFNIVGTCNPLEHYMIPPLGRNTAVSALIDDKKFFVIHGPRQSGKTTILKALIEKINAEGKYFAFDCSLGGLREVYDENLAFDRFSALIAHSLYSSRVSALNRLYEPVKALERFDNGLRIRNILSFICSYVEKDVVVFFDEFDCLTESVILSLLAQLRDGYLNRPWDRFKFPRSLALVGMSDIMDYRTKIRSDGQSVGTASPFNVKYESLSVQNFTIDDIRNLYTQHTDASGQIFKQSALEQAWFWSEGQPWIVNALANLTVRVLLKNDYSIDIDGTLVDSAANELYIRNRTHFDSLAERLKQPLVRRVMEAVIIGDPEFPTNILEDDIRLCIDLGLLKRDNDADRGLRPANPMYKEVIARVLSSGIPLNIPPEHIGKWMDGKYLDMTGLLEAFQIFWLKNYKIIFSQKDLITRLELSISQAYQKLSLSDQNNVPITKFSDEIRKVFSSLTNEAYCMLVIFAFLQRVLNGGAEFVAREYALGRGRVDICIKYKNSHYPIELKIKGAMTVQNSIEQLLGYMDSCKAEEGWLVFFDRGDADSDSERIGWDIHIHEPNGKKINIVTC
ncbi:MAG: ATP-binding protein [Deltaproteobacteria bacterium]|jgi:hypothetical protein|nr:ATP-binding protein [Deltaproteobacteria bacterium]